LALYSKVEYELTISSIDKINRVVEEVAHPSMPQRSTAPFGEIERTLVVCKSLKILGKAR